MCLASKPYPNFLRGRRYQPYTRARQGSLIQPILSYLPATVMISTTPKQLWPRRSPSSLTLGRLPGHVLL